MHLKIWESEATSPMEFRSQYVCVPRERVLCMLWTIFAILLILWLLGWGFHVAGSLIHLLLVVALVVLLINFITGRRVVD